MEPVVAEKKQRFFLLFCAVGLLLFGIIYFFGSYYVHNDLICKGVTLAEKDLSNLERDKALAVIEQICQQQQAKKLVLKTNEREWRFALDELGIVFDAEKTLDKALAVGRNGNILERVQEICVVTTNGKEIQLAYQMNSNKVKKVLQQIAAETNKGPKEATFKVNSNDTVEIVPEEPGQELLIQDSLQRVKQCLGRYWQGETVELCIAQITPNMTAEYLKRMQINQKISSYTTSFDASKTNRTHNIRLAAESINGTIIEPGGVFSFNDTVGPRKVVNGYKMAPIISGEKLIDGIGGGVCQVSSTLYNAVLLADLEIIERTGHSMPVPYVPKGRDATVNFGSLDFRFRNNTDQYLLIYAGVNGSYLTVKLFGRDSSKTVKLTSEEVKVIRPSVQVIKDNTLPIGYQEVVSPSKPGYQVIVWRTVEQKGKTIKKEVISNDRYAPIKGVVKIGTS